mgnify:CR=1 FL=1
MFVLLFVQVNQKMMKSALIKDLYSEMERLKAGTTVSRSISDTRIYTVMKASAK